MSVAEEADVDEDLVGRVQRLEDRAAICELQATYCFLVDDGRFGLRAQILEGLWPSPARFLSAGVPMTCARSKTMESKAPLSRATSGTGGWGEGRQDPGASYFRRRGG